MPPSRQVREQALILAARHCCVCHRYRGVKVEVHHIVPEADGGENSLENAITLCFDCHTDAGHYNSDHPRGTKFSRAELRAARDRWHRLVEKGAAEQPGDLVDAIQSRYLISTNFSVTREILQDDLSQLPFSPALLVSTEPFRHLAKALTDHRQVHHRRQVLGDTFDDAEAYLRAYPGAEVVDRSQHARFPFFQAYREVTRDEIARRIAPQDLVTNHLLATNLTAGEISRVMTYREACGGSRTQEVYLLRPLWLVLLAIQNVASESLTLLELQAHQQGDASSVFEYEDFGTGEEVSLRLPRAPISPGESVVLPIAAVLPNFSPSQTELYTARVTQPELACQQTLSRTAYPAPEVEAFQLWGPSLAPKALHFRQGSTNSWAVLHELDPSNVYTLSRRWAMGSCPHCFIQYPWGKEYFGELFALEPGKLQEETLYFPSGSLGFEVVELEDEVTIFSSDSSGFVCLEKGDHKFLGRTSKDFVKLHGTYFPTSPVICGDVDPVARNELVRDWLARDS